MDRKIKFRQWTKADDEFKGSMMYHDNPELNYSEAIDLHNEKGHIVLMQFTGLKDKNGKEIYEGDVLNISFGGDRNNPPYLHKKVKVFFSDEYLQWYVIGGNIINGNSLAGYWNPSHEIIGNIFEQLEEKKGGGDGK